MKKLSLPILMIAALLVLSSCNFPSGAATATVAPMDAINTAAAQTVIAMSTALAATTPAPATGDSTQAPQETAVPATDLPVVTLPPLASATPASGGSATVCDRMKFVKDITVPDHTSFAPNTSFTKTWRLQNAGTCTWTSGYHLVFDTGDALNGPSSISLPGNVAPGQEVDVSINLKTPADTGEYTGYWKLENASGHRFGWGDGDKAIWAIVDVKTTPVPFAVIGVDMSVDHDNVVADCPYAYTFDISIRTSGDGSVTYYLESSDGQTTSLREVNFSKAETVSVSRTMKFDKDFQGWVKVYIDNPNHQYFGRVNLKLDCN